MKLNPEAAFGGLIDLLRSIGAREVSWEPKPPIDLDIEIEDVTTGSHPGVVGDLFKNPGNLIGAYGKQCLIYIPYNSTPKFHFMECSTIVNMKNLGRFERYTITNRTSGIFTVRNPVKQEIRLDVCQNCFNQYKFRNRRDYSVQNFNIALFFQECKPLFDTLPSGTDAYIPEDIYKKKLAKDIRNLSKFSRMVL